tara:strand:- start:910 stop:1587 length:678 start_codon:yes stop_codon:yes gene_type:complete
MEKYTKPYFPNAKVEPIFPIGIMTFKYENSLEMDQMSYFLKSQPLNPGVDGYGKISEDTYILDNPELSSLKEFITKAFLDYAKIVARIKIDGIALLQSWISVKLKGQMHTPHQHSNSMLSGVFYFDDYDINSPPLSFHKEINAMNKSSLLPNLEENYNESDFAQHERYFFPQKNTFVVFPSYLTHGVPPNPSERPRISLAVNCISSNTFGSKSNLAEIDYDRLKK